MAVCLPGWALCALRSWAPKDVVWLSLPGCHVPPGMLSGQGLLSQSGTYRRHRSDRQRRFRLAAPRELAESLPGGTHQGGFIPRTWCRGGLPALAPNCKGRLVSPGQKDLALAPGAQSTKPVLGVLAVRGGGGGSAQHPLRPTSEPAPAAWAERTWGGEVLWRRLVDICSNSKSQGFLLALAQQAPGAAWGLGPGPGAGWVLSLPLRELPRRTCPRGLLLAQRLSEPSGPPAPSPSVPPTSPPPPRQLRSHPVRTGWPLLRRACPGLWRAPRACVYIWSSCSCLAFPSGIPSVVQ